MLCIYVFNLKYKGPNRYARTFVKDHKYLLVYCIITK